MKTIIFWLLVVASAPAYAVETLRLALLPIPDALPVHVAAEAGFFEREGVAIEVVPVGSAMARDQLIQAGQVDGMLNELSTTAALNRESPTAMIVAVARVPQGNSPMFRIVAAPDSGISSVAELAGVAVGVSRNTVIEYISDRMLRAAGLPAEEIRYLSVPVLPERLQLLLAGRLKAATLPDPLGFSALASGGKELASDLGNPLSLSVITLTNTAITEKREAVAAFVRAWNAAAEAINADPEKWRATLIKNARVPKNVVNNYPIPTFPVAMLPSERQWNDTTAWMTAKGLLPGPQPYSRSVTAEFQPAAGK